MEDRDDWPAWGRLIDEARDRLHPTVSQNEAGRRLGMSGTNWRRVVQGRTGAMESPRGVDRLARMAQLAGVTPEQLQDVGRPDAAERLRVLLGGSDPGEPESPALAGLPDDHDERVAELSSRLADLAAELAAMAAQRKSG